jgi:protocatechuate 3,4-dioxygenase beta subunit
MQPIINGRAILKLTGAGGASFGSQRIYACEDCISPFMGYSILAPVKNDLRKQTQLPEVEVSGVVRDSETGQALKHARIEVWHSSAQSLEIIYRAQLHADENGNYNFITDIPNREKGKNYCIYFKITHRQNSYFTKLLFNHSLALISSRTPHGKSRINPGRQPEIRQKARATFHFTISIPAYPRHIAPTQTVNRRSRVS